MRNEFAKLNDGVASVYREKKKQTDFNAKINARGIDDLDFICKLPFEEMSKRQQDVEFANQNGFALSVKIRTRVMPKVTTKCKVIIGNILYDIYDMDKTRTDLYLYLQEVRQIDT
jgi:SPP1 family predicted phage head-tail adaptor